MHLYKQQQWFSYSVGEIACEKVHEGKQSEYSVKRPLNGNHDGKDQRASLYSPMDSLICKKPFILTIFI